MDPGAPVRVVATKWGGRPHWEFDAVWLGTDEHGSWVGIPVGTFISRPGASLVTNQLQVVLFPEAGYVATFYDDAGQVPCRVYVDIATAPEITTDRVSSVDLDLDVIVGVSGRVWVDDEDEFAQHRVAWGYPDDVVASAVATCAAVQEAIGAQLPPFDGSSQHPWMRLLERLTLEG